MDSGSHPRIACNENSVTFNTFSKIISWRNLVIGLLLVLLSWFYLYKIEIFPGHDYDETGYLNIPYRFVTFGDTTYPVVLSDSFNNAAIRKNPPPLAFWLRNIFHYFAGFSDKSSRVFSALLLLSVVIVTVVVMMPRIFAFRWLTLLPLVVIGFNPSIMQAARSVRVEQEVVFLGTMSILGIPLLLNNAHRRRSLLLWFLSGVLAGWAALSHPWSMVFPAVLLLSLVAYRRTWAELDGLSSWPRFLSWLVGLAVPFGITVAPMIADWQNFQSYSNTLRGQYAIRDVQMTELLSQDLPWLKQYLPARPVAQIRSLDLAAFFNWSGYRYPVFFKALFWIELLIVAVYASLFLLTKPNRYQILIPCATWLALASVVFTFIYPPNTNYYLYPAFSVPLAFALVSLDLFRWATLKDHILRKAILTIPGLILVLGAIGTVHFTIYEIRWISKKSAEGSLISVDTKFKAISEMASMVSLSQETRPIYGDLITWIAGGRNQKSLLEATVMVSGPVPDDVGGVVFLLQLFEPLVYHFPSLGSVQLTQQEKIERVGALLRPTTLSGVIFEKSTGNEYHFYTPKDRHNSSVWVGLIESEDSIAWMSADLQDKLAPTCENQICSWSNVSKGSYLLLLDGEDFVGQDLRMAVDGFAGQAENDFEQDIRLGPIHKYVPKTFLLDVPEGGADIRFFVQENVSAPPVCQSTVLFRLTPFE